MKRQWKAVKWRASNCLRETAHPPPVACAIAPPTIAAACDTAEKGGETLEERR